MAATGPLVSLSSLPWWWSAVQSLCALVSVAFLALTCGTDPGIIPAQLDPDPLIAQLDAHAALVQPGSVVTTVAHEGMIYRLMRVEHVWTRLAPGAQRSTFALQFSYVSPCILGSTTLPYM